MVQKKTMVVTDTLERVSLPELTRAYNLGFSDYRLAVAITEEKLQSTNIRYGYNRECSVGLFDDNTLVGFVINGLRDGYAYDSGTAIIPGYRGRGYARLLLEKALSLMNSQGVHTWVLEVLSDNTKAINLYKSIGFTQQRGLNCYQVEASLFKEKETELKLTKDATIPIPQGDCLPSWQNTEQSIIAGGVPVWNIMVKQEKVGTLCYENSSGSIAQLYIQEEERHKGYAREAIIEAAKLCKTDQLRFINIDEQYAALNTLLHTMGFQCFAKQLEMTNTLRGKA